MSICTCVGMCGCGGAIVAGVLYYHYSNCNNKIISSTNYCYFDAL